MSTINGQEYQHATLTVRDVVAGFQFTSFKKLSFKSTGEKKPVMDSQGQVVGFTFDNQKLEGSISMRRSEWETFCDQLLKQNQGLGIGQVQENWAITYGNKLSNLRTRNLLGVMFQADPFDSEDNQEALVVEIPLFLTGITDKNGVPFVIYPLQPQP